MGYPPDWTMNELCREVYAWAQGKGWWEEGRTRTIGDLIALMHSELSEALEEHRHGHAPTEIYYPASIRINERNEILNVESRKPEGIPIELADVVIRIADFCGRHDIDLDNAIRLKLAYNRTRPYRHGEIDAVGAEGKAL